MIRNCADDFASNNEIFEDMLEEIEIEIEKVLK